MNFSDWKQYYDDICADFGIDQSKDEIAAEIFDILIHNYLNKYVNENFFFDMIKGKKVFIFGASPALESDIVTNKDDLDDYVVIAADGATSAFIKYDIYPDIIVTDLDGVVVDQINANMNGSILVIHAHADNISTIQEAIPKIKGNFFGTIQTNPKHHHYVHNYGGFTDGDRSVFFADHFHPNHITLGGFDCRSEPGFYSYQNKKNIKIKRKKLHWCEKLLENFPPDYLKKI